MVQCDATVTETGRIGLFKRIRLEAPHLAAGLSAGRFVLADLGRYLRTPLFPAHLDQNDFEVLVGPHHRAAALQPGAQCNLIGPLGRGYELPSKVRHILLVADMPHLPVLLPLIHQKPALHERSGLGMALLLSAATARELYPIHLLPPSLEVQIATDDGSVGQAGSLLDLLPNMLPWADCICIAADRAMYPPMANVVRRISSAGLEPPHATVRPRFAQALVVPSMVCGVGACQGCAVSTHRGPRLACTTGPVFDLLRLL
jgi:dihydroorotate dehydrogenase electron transfer subunit